MFDQTVLSTSSSVEPQLQPVSEVFFTAISAAPVRRLDTPKRHPHPPLQAGSMAPAWLAKLYAVGDSTIETYFKRQLSQPKRAGSGASSEAFLQGLAEDLRTDIVAAAIKVYQTDAISDRITRRHTSARILAVQPG